MAEAPKPRELAGLPRTFLHTHGTISFSLICSKNEGMPAYNRHNRLWTACRKYDENAAKVPDERRSDCEAVRKAHKAQGSRRICEENTVRPTITRTLPLLRLTRNDDRMGIAVGTPARLIALLDSGTSRARHADWVETDLSASRVFIT